MSNIITIISEKINVIIEVIMHFASPLHNEIQIKASKQQCCN